MRVPGWPTRCTRAQYRAGPVRGGEGTSGVGGSCGGGRGRGGGVSALTETPPGAACPRSALQPAAPRVLGPATRSFAVPRPTCRPASRPSFRLTSLCLEFAAASPDARSQFHGLWAPRGARDRKPAGAGRGRAWAPWRHPGKGRRGSWGEGLLSCWQGCVCNGCGPDGGRHRWLPWECSEGVQAWSCVYWSVVWEWMSTCGNMFGTCVLACEPV